MTQLRAAMMRQLGGRRRVLVVVTRHDASSQSRMRACNVCLCSAGNGPRKTTRLPNKGGESTVALPADLCRENSRQHDEC